MATTYRIVVHGHLDHHWSTWFEGLSITNEPTGETVLAGRLADQAALHGILIKLRDLGLPLIAVQSEPEKQVNSLPRRSDMQTDIIE